MKIELSETSMEELLPQLTNEQRAAVTREWELQNNEWLKTHPDYDGG